MFEGIDMRTTVFLSAALVAALAAGAATPAGAKERCLEGRTRSGECVDPEVAQAGVKDAILATQTKLSMTAPLVLPGDPDEGRHRYNYTEGGAFFRSAPIGGGARLFGGATVPW